MRRILLLLALAGCTDAYAQGVGVGVGVGGNATGGVGLGLQPVFSQRYESLKAVSGYSSFTRATTATTYSESAGEYTASTTASGSPRYIDHPVWGSGFISEPSAQNKMLQNYDLGTTWGVIDAGDTIGGTVDDIFGASRSTLGIIADSTDGQHGSDQAVTVTAVAWTYSCVGEPGDQDWMYMANTTVANATHYCNVSTCVNGTTGAGATAIIVEDYGTKCRCSFTFTGTAAAHTFQVSPAAADGDNTFAGDGSTVNLYAEHCQVELGTVPTTIIPTTTSAVTRNADVLTYTGTGLPVGGSIVVKLTIADSTAASFPVYFNAEKDTSNRITLFSNTTTGDVGAYLNRASAVTNATIEGGDITDGTRHTMAFSFNTNAYEMWEDGASQGTDASGALHTGNDEYHVGHFEGGNHHVPVVTHSVEIFDTERVSE